MDTQREKTNKFRNPEFVHFRNKVMKDAAVIPSGEKSLNDKLGKLVLKSDIMRESISEFIATFILVLMGDCVLASLFFSQTGNAFLAAAPMGWGLALMVAVAVTGGASGCHANPAVSLAFASIGKLKWNRVLPYFLAQYMGAFVAATLVFALYYDSIADYDGGVRQVPPSINATAQLFATYPQPHISLWTGLLDQVLGTGLLLLGVVAILDPKNLGVHKGLYPLLIGLTLAAIVYALPYNCGAPLNPARDLAPRLFTLIAGYGKEVISHRGYGYFLVPIVGPHVGAILGVWIYKLGIDIHLPDEKISIQGELAGSSTFEKRELEDSEPLDEGASEPTAPLIQIER